MTPVLVVALVSLGLLAAPFAAEAQQAAKIARIGYLATNLAANPNRRINQAARR
jgi:hypothetical protein